MTTVVEVVSRGQSHVFHLQPEHDFQQLLQNVRLRFRIESRHFALHLIFENEIAVDADYFQRLRRQQMPFTLYVRPQPDSNELEKPLARLDFRQDNQNATHLQLSFDQNDRQSTSSPTSQIPRPTSSIHQQHLPAQHSQPIYPEHHSHHEQQQHPPHNELKVQCDICFAYPIEGAFYKCLVCPNFDLCCLCEQHFHHFHPLLLVLKPRHYPREISVIFSSEQVTYMRSKLEEQHATIKQIKRVFYEKDAIDSQVREIDPATLKSTHLRAKNFAAYLLEGSL